MLPGGRRGGSHASGHPVVAHRHHCRPGGELENLVVQMVENPVTRARSFFMATRLRLFLGRPDGFGFALWLHRPAGGTSPNADVPRGVSDVLEKVWRRIQR